jgi:DMSO/TMAO reductase YedYZ molybdopterin-dependent catalytic subunit
MEKVLRHKNAIVVVFAVLLLVMILVVFYIQTLPINLYPQEIRQYQGQNLSSIGDVLENAIQGTQYINSSTYNLTVTGLVNKTLVYTYDQVINSFQNYQKVVTLYCVEGWSATILWEGFLVKDLLQQAGVDPKAVAVIFYASDGFTTSLPLDYLYSKDILIAYKMNGLVIPPERGFPFQLVAESQLGYKWIKWITKIEVTDNPNYLGYWESRGYPNNATIP